MRTNLLKGARAPKDNESRFLLDVPRRDLPGEDTMRRYRHDDEVDLVVVGAGAGGSVLAQRLARRGWRVVILEAGPFWHPDEDWVSDEAGSHDLYWTQKRIIGGDDPIELGKNNSGRGVGRLNDSLRRLRASLSPIRFPDTATRWRGGGLANLLCRPARSLCSGRTRASGCGSKLAMGRPPLVPVLAASGERRCDERRFAASR